MSNLLSIQDLNTSINHEPRIKDIRLGEVLGFERPRKIRELITANKQELEGYGGVCPESGQTSEKGGRPSTTYWLNEPQTLLVCMFSRTPNAAEVRKAIVEVFMAYRQGQLTTQPAYITEQQACLIHDAIWKRKEMGSNLIGYYWKRFKNHFQIKDYRRLPAHQFEEAMAYIPTIPEHGVMRESPEYISFAVESAVKTLEKYRETEQYLKHFPPAPKKKKQGDLFDTFLTKEEVDKLSGLVTDAARNLEVMEAINYGHPKANSLAHKVRKEAEKALNDIMEITYPITYKRLFEKQERKALAREAIKMLS